MHTRFFLLMPLLIAILAGIGYAALRAAGFDPHARELLAAAAVALTAGELSLVPLVLARSSSQLALTQASLAATALHLMLSIALAAAAMLVHLGLKQAMLFWMLPLYAATLIVVVMACIRALRAAPPVNAAARH